MIYDIYCSWVSTWWQCSVDLYINRKATTQKEKHYTKQHKKYRITKYTKYKTKYETKNKHKINIMKHKSSS